MSIRKLRQYEEIWIRIKQYSKSARELSITAPVEYHARIIKGVIKEKHMDEGFKYELALRSKRAVLCHYERGSIITFYLKFNLSLEDL